jgi:hypothetical protein
LALALVSALSAIAVASASAALPEFTGTFPNAFEMSGGAATFENVPLTLRVTCQSYNIRGEITSSTAATVSVGSFKECSSAAAGTCTSTGAVAGEIKTTALPIAPVYIVKATKEVGLVFNYEGTGFPPPVPLTFATFTCGGVQNIKIQRAVVGKITPINTKTKTFTVTLAQHNGRQIPEGFEGTPTAILYSNINGGEFKQTGLQATATFRTAKETELKA